MKTNESKPEKRLGFMPIGQMLGDIRKVFPNAKIAPLGDSEDPMTSSEITERTIRTFPLWQKKSPRRLQQSPDSQPDLPLPNL